MRKTKIIYLDIDGVLNSKYFYNVTPYYTWDLFDPKCVQLLNWLTREHRAKIILISDWRKNYSLQTIKKVFKKNHIESKIAGIIDTDISKEEGVIKSIKTISETLKINFVILDDELDLSNTVKINPEFGFTLPDYRKANKILNQKHERKGTT